MFYAGKFRANLVVYRFCEVLSYEKWTLSFHTQENFSEALFTFYFIQWLRRKKDMFLC